MPLFSAKRRSLHTRRKRVWRDRRIAITAKLSEIDEQRPAEEHRIQAEFEPHPASATVVHYRSNRNRARDLEQALEQGREKDHAEQDHRECSNSPGPPHEQQKTTCDLEQGQAQR
jgi:hypothetical protein